MSGSFNVLELGAITDCRSQLSTMAGVATPPDEQTLQGNTDWAAPEDQQHNTNGNGQQPSANGDSSGIAGDDSSLPGQDPENPEYPPRHPSSVGDSMSASGNNSKGDSSYRGEKQVKVLTRHFLRLSSVFCLLLVAWGVPIYVATSLRGLLGSRVDNLVGSSRLGCHSSLPLFSVLD
jgi:hypothetical protein